MSRLCLQHYQNPGAVIVETNILSVLNDVNVVRYIEHSVDRSELVMEYVEGGSLLSLLKSPEALSLAETLSLSRTFLAGEFSLPSGCEGTWKFCVSTFTNLFELSGLIWLVVLFVCCFFLQHI